MMSYNTSYISQLQMCCSSDIHVYVKVERNVSLANSHKMFQMVASFTRCFKLDKYSWKRYTLIGIWVPLKHPMRPTVICFVFFSVFNCNTVHVVKHGRYKLYQNRLWLDIINFLIFINNQSQSSRVNVLKIIEKRIQASFK